MTRLTRSRLSILFVIACCWSLLAAAASRADDDVVVYRAAIFVAEKDRAIDPSVLKEIATRFPELIVLTKVTNEPTPGDCLLLLTTTGEDFGVPNSEVLKYRGKGLTGADSKLLTSAQTVWPVVFRGPKLKGHSAIRRDDLVLLKLAELTGGIIYDDTTRQYCSQSWWKQHRVAAWQDDVPNIARFITIDFYQAGEARGDRAISLGMMKFGLPDVVVNDMPKGHSDAMGSLINLALQHMIEVGLPVSDDGKLAPKISLDLTSIRNNDFRTALEKTVLEKASRRLEVAIAEGKHESGDPEGPLIELTFANIAGKTPAERQSAAVSTIFGSVDDVTAVKHDAELLGASQRAKDKLPQIRERFQKGLAPNERLLIKGPFKTTAGNNEWMWVEVNLWPPGEISGILMNDPRDVPALKSGSTVKVQQADVFDYLWYEGDQIVDGGETVKIMQRGQGK